jgi:hypothetical protein
VTQKQRILTRLQAGPASAAELVTIAVQYNARIYELRNEGYVVDLVDVPGVGSVFQLGAEAA